MSVNAVGAGGIGISEPDGEGGGPDGDGAVRRTGGWRGGWRCWDRGWRGEWDG